MGERMNMFGGGGGSPSPLQHVVRLMTILVVIVGVAFLGFNYLKSLGRKGRSGPEAATRTTIAMSPTIVDNATGEEDVVIDTRLLGGAATGDNVPVTRPEEDNVGEIAAIVGLASVKDGATIEPQPLYWLLREVQERRPADDLFMKRARVVSPSELRADPDRFRLKPVTIQGTVIRVERSTLPENPSGIREVIEGDVVVDREGICMFLASRVTPVQKGQVVEIHGLFMKLVRYAGKAGQQEDAPLVITSHVTQAPTAGTPAKTFSPGSLVWVLGGLFIVYFVMMLVLRRRQQSRNALFEARRKAKFLTRGGSSGEVGEDRQDEHGPQETEEP